MLQRIKATTNEACYSRHKSYVRPELILRLYCQRRYLFDRLKVAQTPLRAPHVKGKGEAVSEKADAHKANTTMPG